LIDSTRHSSLPVLLFGAALLALLPGIVTPANCYDEGLTLLGADRLLRGELPYRDFWNTHTPGQIAVTALVFRLVGPSILAARAFDIAARAAWSVVVFLLADRAGPRWVALAVWAAEVVLLASLGQFGIALTQAVGLSLASLLATLWALAASGGAAARGRPLRLLLPGLLAGLGILFRHDLGTAGAIAAAATIGLGHLVFTSDVPVPARLRSALAGLAVFAAGVAAVVVPAALLFLATATPFPRLLEIFVTYPLRVYPRVRAVPVLAGTAWLGVLVLELLPLAALAFAFSRPGRAPQRRRSALALSGTAALVLLTSPFVLVRADWLHQIALSLPALALLPVSWWLLAGVPRLPPAVARLGVVALATVLLRPALQGSQNWSRVPSLWRAGTSHGIPRAWGVPLEADQVEAIRAVWERVPPRAPLFVGNTRHDRAYRNDAIFYFLAERACVTYYHNLLPGLVTTERVQRQMTAELVRAAPPVVVLRAGLDRSPEANQSRVKSGVTLLDDAIRAGYRLEQTRGHYQIWTRR